MYYVFLLSVMAFGAFASMSFAESKHRSRGGWFVAGATFPLIALLMIISLPALPAPKAHA